MLNLEYLLTVNITHIQYRKDNIMIRTYYLLVIIMLAGCTGRNANEVRPLYQNNPSSDLIYADLQLCEIKENVHPVLDTIISRVIDCPNFKNKPISFVFTSYIDSLQRTLISIENNTEISDFDYSICDGVFYYKGYQFAYIGNKDNLIKEIKEKVYYIKRGNLHEIHNEKGEFFHSSWNYLMEDETFKCISYTDCGEYYHAGEI